MTIGENECSSASFLVVEPIHIGPTTGLALVPPIMTNYSFGGE
jgi:hypothetical protein